MKKYDHNKIEKKWQTQWEQDHLYKADDTSKKEKYYVLDMFPYPSGDGLHVGHVESYTATDIYARFKRMQGYEVIHPMGWDAFGLPAENFAIKTGTPPKESTKKATDNFRKQIKRLGLSYDWSREIGTHTPEYYKWTQWIFLQLYNKGLAYKKEAKVNWCESCKTVLANEQVVNGACERCKNEVIQKDLEQWFFKITDYADQLVDDLEKVDWPESTKINQRNWIGQSEGAELSFKIKDSKEVIDVFTTRPDTLFGATYMVLAPDHPLVKKLKPAIENWTEVEKYQITTDKKTNIERTAEGKEKTGVALKGILAINPANQEEIPVFIADYVLAEYGTGAIMAVPAHDERDFAFANKFNLPIKSVIEPITGSPRENEEENERVVVVLEDPKKNTFLTLQWKHDNGIFPLFIGGGVDNGENHRTTAEREIAEETGFQNFEYVGETQIVHHHYIAESKGNIPRYIKAKGYHFRLTDQKKAETNLAENEIDKFELKWVDQAEAAQTVMDELHAYVFARLIQGKVYTGSGYLANSGQFDDLASEEAKQAITKQVGGTWKHTYRLRDWLVSRQRYWGAPIPIVYDPKGQAHPVPEEHLPWLLPTDVEFKPEGVSPLADSKEFITRTEKIFGKGWRPEIDTMDTFVCSSWYFLRFADPHNPDIFANQKLLKKWLPVDIYMGGAEHTVLHLMYARFFTKVLRDLGYVDFDEPFLKLRHQGMILAEDGRKMSKSLGNVINPDDVVKLYGADTIRLYEMFMGPIADTKPWNTQNIMGVRRLIEKVWRLADTVSTDYQDDDNMVRMLHQTIEKVTADTEQLKFNTAISQCMIFVNAAEQAEALSVDLFGQFLAIFAPYAPHVTEELWAQVGYNQSIHGEPWPAFDANLITEKITTFVIQVNGKVRGRFEAPVDISEKEAKLKAVSDPHIQEWITGEPKKTIFIAGKLINFVT